MTDAPRMHAVNIRLKETSFVNFSGRKCCRLCREVLLSPELLRPLLVTLSVNYFFDHNHICVLLNISALRVKYGIQAFGKFKRPECNRLGLREVQFQKFSGPPLERRAVGAPDGCYRAHIATILYISWPPLSQNPPSAPVRGCVLDRYSANDYIIKSTL